MGGSDSYCSVSGARYFYRTGEFIDRLDYELKSDGGKRLMMSASEPMVVTSLSDELRKGLHYSDEDVESSSRFVLFCPYEILENGTMRRFTEFDDPHPTVYAESTITEVFNVYPGDNPEYGDYSEEGGESFLVLPYGNSLIVTYASYLILKQAAPEVKPHILYALAYRGSHYTMGDVAGIDYGPVGRVFDQYAHWPAICDYNERGFENPIQFWRWLLTQEGRTNEEILHDAWKGPGNMWVFVRPDRFPITETLAAKLIPSFPYVVNTEPTIQNAGPTLGSLPPDIVLATCEFLPIRSIYALITTCKRFRSIILPHVNPISRRRLVEEEPWYLPAGPFKLNPTTTSCKGMHGREEVEWWAAQWTVGGISPEDMDDRIPWFVYRKECSKSMSMWNRKRIWEISKQLGALARAKGLV